MMFFPGLQKRRYTCWICLESADSDSTWCKHTCGCNLQLHKKCYIKWLYSINKKLVTHPICTIEFDDMINNELKRKMSYLVDAHNELGKDVTIGEVLLSTPLLGDYIASFMTLPFSIGASMVGFRKVLPTLGTDLMYPPVMYGDCPQCKKPALSSPVTYRKPRSFILDIISILRKLSRTGATLALVEFLFLNGTKWWFKLGLWQLRLIFPEKVLRYVLEISTTKALDVYSDSLTGLASISEINSFLAFGLPVYLGSLIGVNSPLKVIQWIWPFIFTYRARQYNNQPRSIVYKAFLGAKIAILVHQQIISKLLNKLYHKFVKLEDVYHYYSHEDEDSEIQDTIIKTSWYDAITQAVIWPYVGVKLGDKIFDAFIFLQRRLSKDPKFGSSPDEIQMIFKFLGCASIVVAKDIIKLYASFKRMKELSELRVLINDTCKV